MVRSQARVKFTFLTGDVNWSDYGGTWISPKQNNGQFDYWFVRELINWNEHESDPEFTYNCKLAIVAPSEFDNIQGAMSSRGYDDEGITWDELSDRERVDVVYSYSGGCTIWQESGNNFNKLLKQAADEATLYNFISEAGGDGAYLDRQYNAIGATGWDVLKGNLIPREK